MRRPKIPSGTSDATEAAFYEALFAHGAIRVQPDRVRRLDAGGCRVHRVIGRSEPADGFGAPTVLH